MDCLLVGNFRLKKKDQKAAGRGLQLAQGI
jgi:hypothetical protein